MKDPHEDLLGPSLTSPSSKTTSKSKLTHLYWKGEGSSLGSVTAIPQRNFRELVEEVIDAPAHLNITREQYWQLDKKEQDGAKRVRYLTAARFDALSARRRYEHATAISLICLDIDDSDHARPYASAPETLADQLEDFNFVIYTTASSTTESPRVRLMVDASGFDPKHYLGALNDIAARIGLPKVTTESKPYVQAMYLPTLFKGDTDENYPVLFSVTDKRAYTPDDIIFTDEASVDGVLFSPDKPSTDLGDLDFLRPPVEDVTLQDVSSALQHIDPDITYHDWLKVATGLKHQFQRKEFQQAAYELFDDWSSKGEKYAGSKETLYKWRSFNISPKDRLPVTVRTVFRIAALNGWDSHHVRMKCFNTCREWINSEDQDVERLFDTGTQRIASVPLLTKSQEEVLLRDLSKRCKKEGLETSIAALRKDLQKLRTAEQRKKASKTKTPAWAKDFCYLAGRNQFLRTTTREFFSPEALDRTYGKFLLPSEDAAAALVVTDGGSSDASPNKPVLRPQDYLLNVIEIPTPYEGIYDPQNPNDRYVREEGRLYVNMYTNNYPQPDILGAEEAGALFTQHLDKLIAEPAYRQVIMDYMAYIVQYPGYKVRWAVLLQGAEGCGKTFLVEALSAMLGQGHVGIVDINAIKSGWNDWAYGSQVVAIEEVRVAGQNRYEMMNAIKPLITNSRISINERFVSSQVVRNNTNYMLFTNHHDALALTDVDRRYFILKSALQSRDQVLRLPHDYFDKLFGMLEHNAGGLRSYFEQWEISKAFDPNGHAPDTHYKKEVVDETGGSIVKAIMDVLGETSNELVRPERIASSTLKDLLNMMGENVTSQTLAATLRQMGYMNIGRQTVEDGDRQYIWTKEPDGGELL